MSRKGIEIQIDHVRVCLRSDPIEPGDPLWECVVFFCIDPFDEERPPVRHRGFVWAANEREAYLHSDEMFDPIVRGKNLLNWYVRQVPPATNLYIEILRHSLQHSSKPPLGVH